MNTNRIDSPAVAAQILQAGGIVAFPTETVFGLGADATNDAAIDRLYAAKGRPSDNPLIVHLSDISRWPSAASQLTSTAEILLAKFAPGPITVVVPKHPAISTLATAGLDTVGLRVPALPLAREILQAANLPIAAPSANRSGRPSGTTWKSVLDDLDGRIDGIVCQNLPNAGIESTVVDCTAVPPVILRPGSITAEQIRSVVPDIQLLGHDNQRPSIAPASLRSPGLRHPHYQPRADVVLIESLDSKPAQGEGVAYCGLEVPDSDHRFSLQQTFESIEDYAAGFYEFLREADRQSIQLIYIQAAPPIGLGQALLDRQQRAASPKP